MPAMGYELATTRLRVISVDATGAINVVATTTPPANQAAFETNQLNVTVAGTGENLQAQAIPNGFAVAIKAKSGNTNSIWVGDSKANSENHAIAFELKAGEVMKLYITNVNLVWIDASVTGEGVNWVVETV